MTSIARKALVVFDIDGTLTDTATVADRVFLRTVTSFLRLPDGDVEWPDAFEGTDSGALQYILQRYALQSLSNEALTRLQQSYLSALRRELSSANAVAGAAKVLRAVSTSPHWSLAFATGNWRQPALHKLRACGLSDHGAIMASSSDAHSRTEILRLAIERSGSPNKVVYLGDRDWDRTAAENLGTGFVAVGTATSADASLEDYRDLNHFWSTLESVAARRYAAG